MVFLNFFHIFTRHYLSMKSLLLCLFLLPLLGGWAVFSLQSSDLSTSLTAGLVTLSDSDEALDVVATLTVRQDVSFHLYPDVDTLTQAVAEGTVVAGYVLDEYFAQSVANLEVDELIQLICLEDDFYHQYLNELVYAALFAQLVPHITQEFLDTQGISAPLDQVKEDIDAYLSGDALFTAELTSPQMLRSEEGFSSPLPLLRGILATGLMVFTLLGAATAAQNQRGWALFSPYLGRFRCECYALIPILVLGYLSGLSTLALGHILSAAPISLPDEAVRLFLYLLTLAVIALILPRLVGRDAIVLLIPFILLFLIITHPIFFDVTSLLPQLKPFLQWLPSYLYIG